MKNVYKLIAVLGMALTMSVTQMSAASGSVALTGTIAPSTTITVTPSGTPQALTLTGNISQLKVADIEYKSNKKNGFVLTLSSANSGNLLGTATDGTAESLPYTILYGNDGSPATVTLTSGSATLLSSSSKTGGTVSKILAISYTVPTTEPAADTYSDTITFTITAN